MGQVCSFFIDSDDFYSVRCSQEENQHKAISQTSQLTGLLLWSIGHLLANGENRSLILFSVLGFWSVLEMIMINRREGVWVKPEILPVRSDVITVLGGCGLYLVLLFAHPYLSGVKLI